MRHTKLLLIIASILLASCATKELLVPKKGDAPVGVDLSGDWVLVGTDGSNQPKARDTRVYLFLETGKVVKATQTVDGMFFSYNRSIVEEYRFGEHRTVRIGEVEAERVSGWEGSAYVVETLDEDGARLIERWKVNAADQMNRSVMIVARGASLMSMTQTFERVEAQNH
ncbi:MAG: hypothetical protein AAF351_06490 [Pseudomonadota bacterium]